MNTHVRVTGLLMNKKFNFVLIVIAGLAIVHRPLQAADGGYSLYVVDPPISNQTILPGRPLPPICKQDKTIQVRACPGEYEPASFLVVARQSLQSVRVEVDALTGPKGTFAKEVVDVRIAKPTAPRFPKENIPGSIPVLLLKDDSLLASEPDPIAEYPEQTKNVWPKGVRDSKELLPVRVDDLKQFWMTVHVPDDAKAGIYKAAVRIIPENAPPTELTLQLEVYDFKLRPPLAEYSIYHPVVLVPEGSPDWRSGKWTGGGGAWLPPGQYLDDLKNMVEHGLTNPNIYEGPIRTADGTIDYSKFDEVLTLREKAGIGPGVPLYIMTHAGEPVTRPLSEEEKQQAIREVRELMAWCKARGYSDVYIGAADEAGGSVLSAERDSFQAIHDGGGKIFVACGGDFYDLVGDLLDMPVMIANTYDRGQELYERLSLTPHPNALPLEDKEGRAKTKAEMEEHYESWMSYSYMRNAHYRGIIDGTHRRGNRIFTYMFPMAGAEVPEVQRRNYGLGLWQMGFDGCMNWSYASNKGSLTEPALFWCYVIRTEDGIIEKVEWEGFREGVDDARYLATLLDVLNRRAGIYGTDPLVVETWTWLGNLDATTDDLNAIRAEMARRILALRGMGEYRKPLVEIDPEKLAGAPKEEKWDIEFTGDGMPTEQGWAGDANSSMFSPNYPAGFLLSNGNPGGSFHRELSGYNMAAGWTLEWALNGRNLQQLPSPQFLVTFSDDTSVLRLEYSTDAVIMKDHTDKPLGRVALKLDDYHIYRLVRQPGSKTVELYVDNIAKPAISVTPAIGTPPAVDAGNLNSVRWGNSLFQGIWDYFRYHQGAAVPSDSPAGRT